MWILVFQRIAIEFILDVLYFPLWWYTAGAKHTLLFCVRLFQDANLSFAPLLWLKNLFVPMFGQRDLQGRLMSIFMRFVNVIGRSIALTVWFGVLVCLFLAWMIFPLAVSYMLFLSFIF
ncbi:MAG TPA: hypothetical protein DCY48_04155 [Candidatus Magasanikbacteria bacterium]|nr:MAG: hypothetical protein A3I74_00290 [Candidatus Magasanikbacteria bacterium RIFCSPLOWO2_02_FULL_47_16]OGH80109.1 MAG: hypothetical protein A3C10_02940 [Candidatus Magasanikbacteria bacterium RIFCSPHIGHO2_02_FULL_48_18]OGH83188.1 MAG: hypothetical protein A3G08_02655 [Candidatus Magasanikbacteria bacterium RIFCSPLOWO2_12_FULL_47_9b]HAZ28938.1 hypothetical protein [Candidatus Magasanikbacteria bacterium]